MEFRKVIENRYSVRAYKSDPIEKKKLDLILTAAQLAPTAANRQPFRLIVIKTEKYQAELLKVYNKNWFIAAPLVICACAVQTEAWKRRDSKNYADVDTTIAMDHLILAAANEGLGTCWIAAFDPDSARSFLRIPPDWEPVAFTPLGYPDDNWKEKRRKAIDDLVIYME